MQNDAPNDTRQYAPASIHPAGPNVSPKTHLARGDFFSRRSALVVHSCHHLRNQNKHLRLPLRFSQLQQRIRTVWKVCGIALEPNVKPEAYVVVSHIFNLTEGTLVGSCCDCSETKCRTAMARTCPAGNPT